MFAQNPVEEIGRELHPMRVVRNVILFLILLGILFVWNLVSREIALVSFFILFTIAIVIFFRMLRIKRKP